MNNPFADLLAGTDGVNYLGGQNGTDQLFGARTTNVLQKATVYLAPLFFVITLALAVMIVVGYRQIARN